MEAHIHNNHTCTSTIVLIDMALCPHNSYVNVWHPVLTVLKWLVCSAGHHHHPKWQKLNSPMGETWIHAPATWAMGRDSHTYTMRATWIHPHNMPSQMARITQSPICQPAIETPQ